MLITSDTLNIIDNIIYKGTHVGELEKYIKLKKLQKHNKLSSKGLMDWTSSTSKHTYGFDSGKNYGEMGILKEISETLKEHYWI